MSRRLASLAAIAAGLLAAMPAAAVAADLLIAVPDSDPGACGDTRMLSRISEKFRWQVTHVPNLPDVEIAEFRNVHERRYLPQQEDRPIARRYCGATVLLSDGRSRSIWYLIEYGMGLASIGDNVEFCVAGFDRWHVYNGGCRVLR